jgi:hypothetical protein
MAGGGSGNGGGGIVVVQASGNVNEGRLTVVSGQPVPVDVDGSGLPIQIGTGHKGSTLYYTPYKGNKISLFKNGVWSIYTFSEISISNAGLGDSTLITVGPYDVFAYADSSGNVALEFSAAWGSFVTRTDAIALQDGIPVKASDHTRKLIGTVALVSAGLHTPPFLFWDGSNVRLTSNLYNKVPLYGYGQEGFSDGSANFSFDLSASAAGQWQVPVFIGSTVHDYYYLGHGVPGSGNPAGDGIYANWVSCENRRVRIQAKAAMLKGGSTTYGMGIGINWGDDFWDVTKIVMASQSQGASENFDLSTEFICPAGMFMSYMSFFAEGGTQVAQVLVNDVARGAASSPRLTYSRLVCDF